MENVTLDFNKSPLGNRLHIGILGKRNNGKSSLINMITGQNIAISSSIPGTTTDPVQKSMEIHGIGPCVFIDTAGFDDFTELGERRVDKTKGVLSKLDIVIMVFCDTDLSIEKQWIKELKKQKVPIIAVINKVDILTNVEEIKDIIRKEFNLSCILSSTEKHIGTDKIIEAITRALPEDYGIHSITSNLVKEKDVVLLVMPQDKQAPKGRLILPQVQTIRDLLDNKCIVISTTTENMDDAISSLKNPPKLIITDSQVFKTVYEKKPKESELTSFSVLFAAYKGDINEFVKGAKSIEELNCNSKVLICEACTHAPIGEDIGRVKIPNMLRKTYGSNIKIDIVSGVDFPENISEYDLIIHCGACMFNRKYVLSRIEKAKEVGVPITNYGIAIAHITGILDKVKLI